jgi:ribosomal protein S18 acetylase RimI-like enzyme
MSAQASFIVRRATADDLPALGRLGALLIRTHYAFDNQRFMAPRGDPEQGYSRFLEHQLKDEDVVVFVAEVRDTAEVAGYVYAGLEPASWKELREASGFIHDVAVDPAARRGGVATALLEAAIDWLRNKGTPRVMLWTAERNDDAQKLFSRIGFRRTMVEMTLEL